MLLVNAVSSEIYLQLKGKSKTENVVAHLANLASDAHLDWIKKLLIVLDNNSIHKPKMTIFLTKEIDNRGLGLSKKITLEFMYTPAYSLDFNLAEYEIYLLRLQELHHLPSDTIIPKITNKLKDINMLTVDLATSADVLGTTPDRFLAWLKCEYLHSLLYSNDMCQISIFTLARILDTTPRESVDF